MWEGEEWTGILQDAAHGLHVSEQIPGQVQSWPEPILLTAALSIRINFSLLQDQTLKWKHVNQITSINHHKLLAVNVSNQSEYCG